MSNPLYARDVATGLNHELDTTEEAPGAWALRVVASLGGHATIDGSLSIAATNNLAVYTQDKRRDDLFMDTVLVGGATAVWAAATGGVTMTVTASGDVAIRQSKQMHNYSAGSPQFYELTSINLIPEVGVIKRIGAFSTLGAVSPFDTNRDGYYLESSAAGLSFKIDKAGVNNFSALQAAWDDPLDGSGASGIDLAPANFQALAIEYLYLGGTVSRFGFLIGASVVWAHTFPNSNVKPATVVTSPVQPVRYEIRSVSGSGHLVQICARAASRGSSSQAPVELDYEPSSFINANSLGTVYALCGVTLTDPRSQVELVRANATAVTADRYRITLRLNPTVAGTFTYNAVAGTGYAIALGSLANPSTNTVTGGTIVGSRTVQSGGALETAAVNRLLHLGATIAGVSDTLVLCVEPLTINLDINGSISIKESP